MVCWVGEVGAAGKRQNRKKEPKRFMVILRFFTFAFQCLSNPIVLFVPQRGSQGGFLGFLSGGKKKNPVPVGDRGWSEGEPAKPHVFFFCLGHKVVFLLSA